MPEQPIILFWVFVTFFVLIGILSLLVASGFLRADPKFRQWAVPGFISAVTVAVIGLFKLAPVAPVPIFVTLNGNNPDFTLVSGVYKYDEVSSGGEVTTRSGPIELTVGQQPGVWQAKLPQDVLNKALSLKLQDKAGDSWAVSPFYPNYNTRPIVKVPSSPHAEIPGLPTASGTTPAFAAMTDSATLREPYGTKHLVVTKNEGPIKIDNYARPYRKLDNRQYYQWRVYVDEPEEVLKEIVEVQYVLHPTFPDPTQKRNDPRTKFAVESTGWGEFLILITVRYTDGSVEKTTYQLNLSKGWPESE